MCSQRENKQSCNNLRSFLSCLIFGIPWVRGGGDTSNDKSLKKKHFYFEIFKIPILSDAFVRNREARVFLQVFELG